VATGLMQLGNWLLLAGAVLFVVSIFNVLRAARQLRGAAYYAVRQEALSHTRRWALLATISLLASVGLLVYLSNTPAPAAIAKLETPTAVVVDVPSRMLPTATFTPSPTNPPPTWTPVPVVTATPLPPPTATLPPNVPNILLTPLAGAPTVSPKARLTFTTLASTVNGKGTPTDPGLAFPNGTRLVRLFFQAANVNNGAVWSVVCYKGEQLVDSIVGQWAWGARSQGARAFCGIDGSPGAYSVAAYLGSDKQFEIAFEILTPTPTPVPTAKP
jgi:hypothetical protein